MPIAATEDPIHREGEEEEGDFSERGLREMKNGG